MIGGKRGISLYAKMKIRAWLAPTLAASLMGCAGVQSPQPQATQQTQGTGDIPSYGKEPSETDYRAVLMSNGMVLFGKLHGLGTPLPVLTDVYYVQAVQDPKTKNPTTVLIKRGNEWHAPDRTVLNASQILLIEPVTEDSKVMNLIAASEKGK
jgi:hypothetical protein